LNPDLKGRATVLLEKLSSNEVLTVFEGDLADALKHSVDPFEAFVGRLVRVREHRDQALIPFLRKECLKGFVNSEHYAHVVLSIILDVPTQILLQETSIRGYVFLAARSPLKACRETAAIVLSRMAGAGDKDALTAEAE
jgi:hypothetical protein